MRCAFASLLMFGIVLSVHGQCLPGRVIYSQTYPPGSFAKKKNITVNVNVSAPKSITTPPAYAPGWREKALDLAGKREDFMSYLKTLDLLGFKGQSFGLAGPFGLSASGSSLYSMNGAGYNVLQSLSQSSKSMQYGGYGVSGNTLYGMSLADIRDLYGSTDLNAVFQQSGMLAKGMQELSGQGMRDFSDRLAELSLGVARVAEINARAKAAAIALAATAPQSASSSVTNKTVVQVNPGVVAGAEAPPPMSPAGDVSVMWRVFMQTKAVPQCAGCHSVSKDSKGVDVGPAGKFDVSTLPNLSTEAKMTVLERVMSSNAEKGMPRDKAGKHAPLSAADKMYYAKALSNN